MENIDIKKVLNKLELQQKYNDIWIKKGDEQTIAFMTLEGFFELIVIFFGLTHSLAMFQIIINKILQDLINIGKVASFINNVIVGIEKEERYIKVVEEVVKRLAENDLYVKLEKYKWKVKEVGFLGVVIEYERIKMVKIKKYQIGLFLKESRIHRSS